MPVASTPKFSVAGVTAMRPGVRLMPLTALVELPPVLVNTTLLVHVPVITVRKLHDDIGGRETGQAETAVGHHGKRET